MTTNRTLQAIDGLLDDFSAATIAGHLRDIYGIHLRNSEGYSHEALADEYEIGLRLIGILADREADRKKQPQR